MRKLALAVAAVATFNRNCSARRRHGGGWPGGWGPGIGFGLATGALALGAPAASPYYGPNMPTALDTTVRDVRLLR
jgi:hypothetical protein